MKTQEQDWIKCLACNVQFVGVEYGHDSPEHYDGISEYMCPKCEKRIGRWSGKTLKEGELEPRYGEKRN